MNQVIGILWSLLSCRCNELVPDFRFSIITASYAWCLQQLLTKCLLAVLDISHVHCLAPFVCYMRMRTQHIITRHVYFWRLGLGSRAVLCCLVIHCVVQVLDRDVIEKLLWLKVFKLAIEPSSSPDTCKCLNTRDLAICTCSRQEVKKFSFIQSWW